MAYYTGGIEDLIQLTMPASRQESKVTSEHAACRHATFWLASLCESLDSGRPESTPSRETSRFQVGDNQMR